MSILITGGAGYIGSHTAIQLLTKGYRIIIADDYSNSSPECISRIKKISNKDFLNYKCNISNFETLSNIFKENNIESVIHFAGYKAVSESILNPVKYYTNNILSTLNLLKVMELYNVKSIVFSSSASVYGTSNISPCTEEMPIGCCTNPYANSKLIIENILKDLHKSNSNYSISILRYFNPIGAHESGLIGEDPKDTPTNLLPYITQVAMRKLPYLTVHGDDFDTIDGTCIRDYIHVEDLARGHVLAIEKQKKINELNVYNLGTGNPTTVLQMIRAFEDANNINIPYKIGKRRDGDIAVCYAGVEKAKKELGFIAKHDIKRMCIDSFRWQKQNPSGMN